MSYPPLGYAYPSAAASLASTQLLMSAAQANATTSSSSTSCCESGRPIFTDPQTGQTICSCQFTPSLLAYPRVAALPDSYTAAAAAYAAQGYAAAFGADPSAFYSPLNAAAYSELKDNPEAAWRLAAQPCYPYDPAAMAAYPYGGYAGMDLNQARRKNATRETTSTLKAWLYEHRKNPYPTKGEKIMLAIITKMTLTQVSTWFANARRRLKKENKMTWSPRNRCGDDEDGDAKDGDSDGEDKDIDSDKEDDDVLRDIPINTEETSETAPNTSPEHTPTQADNADKHSDKHSDGRRTPPSPATKESRKSPSPVKPRIWSLAHVATSGNTERKSPPTNGPFPTSPKPGQPYPSAIHTLSHWVDGRYPAHLRLPHPYSFPAPIAHTTTTSALPGGTPSTGSSTKVATPLPSSIRYPPTLSRLPSSTHSDERRRENTSPLNDKPSTSATAFRPVVKGSFPSAIKT